jgi:hypothetical protein
MRHIILCAALFAGLLICPTAHAADADHGLAAEFSWQSQWGTLNMSTLGDLPYEPTSTTNASNYSDECIGVNCNNHTNNRYTTDPKIPTQVQKCAVNQAAGTVSCALADISPSVVIHAVKTEIKYGVSQCGTISSPTPAQLSKIRTYTVSNFDGQGHNLIVIDPFEYFTDTSVKSTCPAPAGTVCSADDAGRVSCNIPFYMDLGVATWSPDGIENPSNLCPGKNAAHPHGNPALNATCRSECAADANTCPHLFTHKFDLVNSTTSTSGNISYMRSWKFMSKSDYAAMRAARADNGVSYIDPSALTSTAPILRAEMADALCSNEEMDVDKSGTTGVTAGEPCYKYLQYQYVGGIGRFVNLYHAVMVPVPPLVGDSYIDGVISYDGDGNLTHFFGLYAGGTVDPVHARGQTLGDGDGFKLRAGYAVAAQREKFAVKKADGTWDYTASAARFACREFINGSSKDVLIPANTDPEYTSFIDSAENGALKADGVSVRECGRKFSPWSPAENTSCAAATYNQPCGQTIVISAERRCVRSTGSIADLSECANVPDHQQIAGWPVRQLYFQAVCQTEACPVAAGFCVAADTKVLMADGTEKEIKAIKSGEEVMAFDRKNPEAPLKKAKVAAVMVTADQKLLSLNDLKITANHKVLLKGGKAVEAKDVKLSDELLTSDGTVIKVNKIAKDDTPVTVYNLDITDADGYVAGGLRVLHYSAK